MPWQQPEGWEPITPAAGAGVPWKQPEGWEPIPAPESAGGGLVAQIDAALKGARDYFQPAANNLVRAPWEILTGQRPVFTGLKAPEEYQRPFESKVGQIAAEIANPIPSDVTGAGAMAGTALAGPLGPLARIFGGGIGAAAGRVAEGGNESDLWKAAAGGAGANAVGETIGAGASGLLRWLNKGRINEGQAQDFLNVARGINPAVGEAIESQQVSPLLRGGTTAAKIDQGMLGGDVKKAMSGRMEEAINAVDQMSGNPQYPVVGAIKDAWDQVPALIKKQITGGPSPGGPQGTALGAGWAITKPPAEPDTLSLKQLQMVRSYLGDRAYSEANPALTTAARELQLADVTRELEAPLSPEALALWRAANKEYGGGMALREFSEKQNAVQGLPNRMFFNRSELSNYLRLNREDLLARMGQPAYDQMVQDALGGAQPGTRDILASGAGTPTTALRQVYGRSQGGAPQILGSLLRTFLPNLGSEYTGRAPFSVPPMLQTIIDLSGQRAMDEARTRGVRMGPLP